MDTTIPTETVIPGLLVETYVKPARPDPLETLEFDLYTKEVLRTAGALRIVCEQLKRWETAPKTFHNALMTLKHLLDGDAAHQEFAIRGGHRRLAALQCENLTEVDMELVDGLITVCADWTESWKFQFPMAGSMASEVPSPPLRFDFTYMYKRLQVANAAEEVKEEKDTAAAAEPQQQPLHVYVCPVPGRMRSHGDVGWVLWPSASVMSRWIILNQAAFQGKRVLEIGSGLGLCGLVAGFFAASVVLSDVNVHALEALKRSIALNLTSIRQYEKPHPRYGCLWEPKGVQVCTLDWNTLPEEGNPPMAALPEVLQQPFDVIIACDSVISESDAEGFVKVLKAFLKPNGVGYMAMPPPSARWGVEHVIPTLERGEYAITRLPLTEDMTELRLPEGEERKEIVTKELAVPPGNEETLQCWSHLMASAREDNLWGAAAEVANGSDKVSTAWPLIRDLEAVSVGSGYEKDVVLVKVQGSRQ